MIKENQRLLNRVNVVTDAVAALAAVAAAYLIVFILLDFDRNYPFTDYLRLALIFIPVQLITYACMGSTARSGARASQRNWGGCSERSSWTDWRSLPCSTSSG